MKSHINGVPRELKPCPFCNGQVSFHQDDECSGCHLIHCAKCDAFFDFATGADPENEAAELCELRALCACAWNHRTLLTTAQPAAEVIETDCRSEEGVTVGLIDALIAICRPLATRDLATPAACAALEDLRSDSDALAIFLGLPPAADGEREVWAVPVLDGEKKTTFYTEQLPFVPGIGVKQLGEPVRMVEARAAQPQQAVAVTDEVRRLREALTRVGDRLEAFIGDDMDMPHDSMEVCKGIIDAALATHKTGEEE